MSTLEKAIELAANYHAGQTDRGGTPYILHLLAVMMAVDGIEAKTIAVLHDILETHRLPLTTCASPVSAKPSSKPCWR